jgi:D-glycero-alpha-D-manno-heptose 1-phosphate guanylyltransferase
MNAIILCGGLATRLRAITEDKIPKCLVDINGTPFIKYQLDQLNRLRLETGYSVKRVILAVGRFHEQVIEYVQTIQHNYSFDIYYSIEPTQLGTGGAMKYAWRFVNSSRVLIMNGDVMNMVQLNHLIDQSFKRDLTNKFLMSLVLVNETDRFGIVKLSDTGKMIDWKPKQYVYQSLANRGIYLYSGDNNPFENYPTIFSFENDFVANNVHDATDVMYGFSQPGYFIDIGIPEDYKKYCEYILRSNR